MGTDTASTTATEHGRVAEDGTVFVRTPDGERPVGSWQAGTPEQGLAFYARRYDDLVTEVVLLEGRLARGSGDPTAVAASARRLREGLATASVVGDLAAVETRLAALEERAGRRQEQVRAARRADAERAAAAKAGLVEEAERLAQTPGRTGAEWKEAGDRLRAIGEQWRGLPAPDRAAERALWQRFAAARDEFGRRRGAHFAQLDGEREQARSRKEALAAEAEHLADSTDWGPAASRFKALMGEWKAAGRAKRADDDALWERFRGAQDRFFAARGAAAAERDAALRDNVAGVEAVLAEAERLDPTTDPEGAQRRLRDLQDRYEAAGRVPRDVAPALEARMRAVEEAVRDAVDARWAAASESPFLVRLREAVAELERKATAAAAAGRPTAELEAQLATQREWLAQAERSGA